MVFRLIDAGSGDEILVDSHGGALGGSVVVTNGLFSVTIGGGVVTDGAGPGIYTSLADVFRDHADVLLRVAVGGEDLSPDVPIHSAA